MNKTDHMVLETYGTYDYVLPIDHGEHFLVQRGDRWGIVTPTGTILIPVEHDWVAYVETSGVFVTDCSGACTAISTDGTVVVPPGYSCIEHLGAHLYEVSQNGGRGVYDTSTHQLVLPCEYTRIEYLDTDRCRVWQNTDPLSARCGVFAATSRMLVVPVAFAHVRPFTPTLFSVSCGPNLHGVFSTIHQTCIVPPRYARVRRLTDTLYLVGKGGNTRPVFFASEEQREYS